MSVRGSESAVGLLAAAERPTLEFAYVDESGDSGVAGSQAYTLACLLAPADEWVTRLDLLIQLRRDLKGTYGIRLRDEIKANYLLRGRGPLKTLNLGDGQRRDIYQRHLSLVRLLGSGAFAVVIQKHLITTGKDPAEMAWRFLFQRLRMRSEATGVPVMLIHDEGDANRVERWHRQFRRHSYAPNGQRVEARQLVEDPVPRRSDNSFFIQSRGPDGVRRLPQGAPADGSLQWLCSERSNVGRVRTSHPDRSGPGSSRRYCRVAENSKGAPVRRGPLDRRPTSTQEWDQSAYPVSRGLTAKVNDPSSAGTSGVMVSLGHAERYAANDAAQEARP